MKTVEIKLYKFSELSDRTKQYAIDNWRNNETFDWIRDEATSSLNKFAEIFNIDWREIDYEEPYRNSYSIDLDENILSLTGYKLAKYIWNHYRTDIFKGKYYGKLVKTHANGDPIKTDKEHPAGMRHVHRYSKIFMDDSCVMTGVCYDQDLLNPIYQFLNKPNVSIDFETLLNDCIYSLCHSVLGEIEANSEDDAIIETIEANDYDFTEDGKLY
jgi:hypothetical protein